MDSDKTCKTKKTLVIFLHGFATSPTDLEMLAEAFSLKGYEIRKPWLPFHPFEKDNLKSQEEFSLEKTKKQIIKMIQDTNIQEYDIYLVGFSLGGALAIDIASELNLSGVLAINPFFEPKYKKLSFYYINFISHLPIKSLKRRFQTTLKKTRKFLSHENDWLPIKATKEVIKNSNIFTKKVHLSKCPILIIHSLDDKVSSFSASAKVVKSAARSDIRLVPIHGLNHFMQFDISPYALRDLALEHFNNHEIGEKIDSNIFESIYTLHQNESKHWSNIIFQLIVGFFTIFGTLLAFTLPDVLQAFWGETINIEAIKLLSNTELIKHQKAVAGVPYYLIAYSFILSLYLILLSLYFFYLNRIDSFIRLHIEPLCKLAPWIQYRTQTEASSKISRITTNAVSIPIVLIPLLASISLLIAIPIIFPDRIFVWDLRNLFLNAFYISSILISIFSIWSLYALQLYTSLVVYGIPAPIKTTPNIELAIRRLYSSVNKGYYGIKKT